MRNRVLVDYAAIFTETNGERRPRVKVLGPVSSGYFVKVVHNRIENGCWELFVGMEFTQKGLKIGDAERGKLSRDVSIADRKRNLSLKEGKG